MLVVNEVCLHAANSEGPFGGVGYSGYGKYHSYEGFRSVSNLKSVFLKPQLNFFPLNHVKAPYDKKRSDLIKKFTIYLNCSHKKAQKILAWIVILAILIHRVRKGQLGDILGQVKELIGMIKTIILAIIWN
mmetsp:Transcript_38457/g.28297  ORF Transcript_38457/g.28297 Transcript_38457/m.28297 type:complete len:131 (+) Transcript_38457:1186-1578(+)